MSDVTDVADVSDVTDVTGVADVKQKHQRCDVTNVGDLSFSCFFTRSLAKYTECGQLSMATFTISTSSRNSRDAYSNAFPRRSTAARTTYLSPCNSTDTFSNIPVRFTYTRAFNLSDSPEL